MSPQDLDFRTRSWATFGAFAIGVGVGAGVVMTTTNQAAGMRLWLWPFRKKSGNSKIFAQTHPNSVIHRILAGFKVDNGASLVITMWSNWSFRILDKFRWGYVISVRVKIHFNSAVFGTSKVPQQRKAALQLRLRGTTAAHQSDMKSAFPKVAGAVDCPLNKLHKSWSYHIVSNHSINNVHTCTHTRHVPKCRCRNM